MCFSRALSEILQKANYDRLTIRVQFRSTGVMIWSRWQHQHVQSETASRTPRSVRLPQTCHKLALPRIWLRLRCSTVQVSARASG